MKLRLIVGTTISFLSSRPSFHLCKVLFSSNQALRSSPSLSEPANNALEQYSIQQQKLILQVINKLSPRELSKFDVTARRAELLDAFRSKSGHFENLQQVLSVKGIGQRGVENLCNSILEKIEDSDGDGTEQLSTAKKTSGSRAALLVPLLEEERRKTLETAVGIHIGIDVVTWAMIDKNNRLLDWNLHDLNIDTRKIHPTALLAYVLQVRRLLPPGDVYVIEDFSTTNQPTQKQVTSLSIQLQKSQLTAMMLAVLNTQVRQNDDVDDVESRNRVFYLRYRTPARLFRTLIGSERVSSQLLVEDIISPPSDTVPPDHFTPLSVDDNQRSHYARLSNVDKENMCQALLLTMAFMDLVVYRNRQSLKVVS